MKIGVLALQGAFIEHIKILRELGVEAVEVRLPEDLEGLDGLIIPGGESTTIGKLATMYHFMEPLRAFAAQKAVWGTCAGMIFMAKEIGDGRSNHGQPLLAIMDIVVDRNAFGRQVDSFETELSMPEVGPDPVPAVFIRAPVLISVGPEVRVLAEVKGQAVAVRQNNILATSFHPELTPDTRLHSYFLNMHG